MNALDFLTTGTPERRAQMMRVHKILYRLHIWPRYKGYAVAMAAVWLALENGTRPADTVTQLYTDAGALCGTNWRAAERSLRTVIRRAWELAPNELDKLAGAHLKKGLTASQFAALLTTAALLDDGETAEGGAAT